MIFDEQKDSLVPATAAVKDKLLDTTKGRLTNPDLPLNQAYQRGYIISTLKPLSLTDLLLRNLYDPNTGLLDIDGKKVTLEKAIGDGDVIATEFIVRDPKSESIINLIDAIRIGVINAKVGQMIDPTTGTKLTLTEALDRGFLIPVRRKCTLPDAVFKGLYDPRSGKFTNTVTPEKLSTERAIRRGLISPDSTIVNLKGKVLPFELAVASGIVDSKRGLINDEYGNKVDFREAFDRGILIEVRKPITLSEALAKNIYNEDTGLFMDPKTGKHLTLSEALETKLIDGSSIQIRDPKTLSFTNLTILDAIKSKLISGDNARVNHDKTTISLKQAFDIGLLWDTKAPISLQRAIHQGIYNDKTGRFADPTTQRKITLHEAMRKFFINPQLPCHFNEEDETLLSLSETCRQRMIDKREGVFQVPNTDNFVSLSQAMNLGLIVDIENAGFGLYETLAMGFYDRNTHKILHPVSNRQMTLQEALDEDIVNSKLSIVKNLTTNKYEHLVESVKSGVIDDTEGVYHMGKGKVIDLQEARNRGFIVPVRRYLTIERLIKLYLYRVEVGKFVDPNTNELLNLQQAIDSNLVDPDTTVFKDLVTGQDKPLGLAIESGDIDINKGLVIDPKNKTSVNFEIALNKGLLVTVPKPVVGGDKEQMVRIEKVELLASPSTSQPLREMSLQEAINYKIIDPEHAYVKDRKTGKFKQLKLAIADNLVNPETRATIDLRQMFFVFNPTLIVYIREPISFDWAIESNLLDLETGKYRDPLEEGEKVYTLKDAITMGLIDPESVLLKDGAKSKLLRLPEGFRKGLIDGEKANVLDTQTSKLLSLRSAVDTGLLTTPKCSLDLQESIKYGLYDPELGRFSDPFTTLPVQTPTTPAETKKLYKLTLADTITKGIITPTTTLVRNNRENGQIIPLQAAITSGLVDANTGKVNTTTAAPESKLMQIDFAKAFEKGLLLPAEQRVSFSS